MLSNEPAETCGGPAADVPSNAAARRAIEQGRSAVESGTPANALQVLGPVVDRRPAAYHPEHGSAARWLGAALLARGDSARARTVWAHGVRSARSAPGTAVGAASALLESMSPDAIREHPTTAAIAYRHIVAQMGTSVSTAEACELRHHEAQLRPLLPDRLKQRLERRASGVARDIQAWWRAEDSDIATARNERLLEHLRRVAVAEERYAWPEEAPQDRASGLDARGLVFLRYGPPGRTERVEFEDSGPWRISKGSGMLEIPKVRDALSAANVGWSSFPTKNVVWSYPRLGDSAYFVFVDSGRRGSPYVFGTPEDLLPSSLQGGAHPQGRGPGRIAGGDRANRMLAKYALQLSIYEQLMGAAPEFGFRYGTLMRPFGLTDNPWMRLQSARASFRVADRRHARRRDEALPNQQTVLGKRAGTLAPAVRTARFLEEDGTTRTEVYWGMRQRDLVPSRQWQSTYLKLGNTLTGEYALQTAFVHRTEDQKVRRRHLRRDTVTARRSTDRPLATRSFVARGDSGRYHLGLQWSQHALSGADADGKAPAGGLAQVGRHRVDSLKALEADPGRLQMSDVLPVGLPEGEEVPSTAKEMRRQVIPFDTLAAGRRVGLAFEVYNLAYGADDRTRYTVEYEVDRSSERGGLKGLFSGDYEEKTATRSTYEGTRRTSTEVFALGRVTEVPVDEPVDVRITVRVTDEVTNRTVERPIAFTVDPSL
jgi:hypothetical protein